MHDHEARRAELIGAALGGDLTPDEERELAQMAERDPSLAAELADLRGTADRLSGAGLEWAPVPSSALADRVAGIDAPTLIASAPSRRSRWSRPVGVLVAAVLVGIGVVGGALLPDRDSEAEIVSGPPGTLGAFEEISFEGAPASVEIDAGLIAHTWGTEADLEIDGLEQGEVYSVELVDDEGRTMDAGSFLGDDITVLCRMNAAVLREQVTAVQITSGDGDVVASADVPTVT